MKAKQRCVDKTDFDIGREIDTGCEAEAKRGEVLNMKCQCDTSVWVSVREYVFLWVWVNVSLWVDCGCDFSLKIYSPIIYSLFKFCRITHTHTVRRKESGNFTPTHRRISISGKMQIRKIERIVLGIGRDLEGRKAWDGKLFMAAASTRSEQIVSAAVDFWHSHTHAHLCTGCSPTHTHTLVQRPMTRK